MNGLVLFRMVTAWVTLALVVFVLWISKTSMMGRFIAAGVLLFGIIQWAVLKRMSHQIAAKEAASLEKDGEPD